MVLPGDARAATSGGPPARWLIGARPGEVADRIARRHGARLLSLPGTFSVSRSRARALADALRDVGVLLYAEPNVRLRAQSAYDAHTDRWARGAVIPPHWRPPAPTAAIGVVDSFVADHPDLAGQVRYLRSPYTSSVDDAHGTMVASAAAAAANGSGVTGVFPGAPIVSFGLPSAFGCEEVAVGVDALIDAGVQVINLSLGGPPCFTEYRSIMHAYGQGITVVASAGNEFQAGNPASYPASYPHVLSVASVGPDLRSSYFSSESAAVDLSAPGEQVPVAIPPHLDVHDGAADGTTQDDGTSFAAPMVAGAAAWLATARPILDNGQIGDLLRFTAADLEETGWDASTGYGILDLRAALMGATPPSDPLEPNDDIPLVNGVVFSRPDRPIWRGYGEGRLRASVDVVEDPADVYRVRLPARSVGKVLVHPLAGDPDVEAYSSRSLTLDGSRPFASSVRGERRTDAITLINRSRRARSFYVVVYVPESASAYNATYRMQVVRVRYRRR